jgi:hypothetical protein
MHRPHAPHAAYVGDANSALPHPWPNRLVAALLKFSLGADCPELGSAHLTPCAAPAYFHPNGFAKLPLARQSRSGNRLVLHVWNAGCADADIHDHRWNFSSRIVSGLLCNVTYDLTLKKLYAEAPLVVCRYESTRGGLLYQLQPVAAVDAISRLDKRALGPGETYGQSASVFHAASAAIETMTLMTRGPQVSRSARMALFARDARLLNANCSIREMSDWDRRRLLERALNGL